MTISRRKFLEGATAAGAALAASCTAPTPIAAAQRVRVQNLKEGVTASLLSESGGGPVAIPSNILMASGAPLGGIGTGFVEIFPMEVFSCTHSRFSKANSLNQFGVAARTILATRIRSGPIGAIESAILNGFAQVARLDIFGAVEIADRARDLQDAIMRARR